MCIEEKDTGDPFGVIMEFRRSLHEEVAKKGWKAGRRGKGKEKGKGKGRGDQPREDDRRHEGRREDPRRSDGRRDDRDHREEHDRRRRDNRRSRSRGARLSNETDQAAEELKEATKVLTSAIVQTIGVAAQGSVSGALVPAGGPSSSAPVPGAFATMTVPRADIVALRRQITKASQMVEAASEICGSLQQTLSKSTQVLGQVSNTLDRFEE